MEDPREVLGQSPSSHHVVDSAEPLRGVVLCCTSIPPDRRSELVQKAEQMGAHHKYDLTSDVTHLIVGDYNTPKYRFVAKERADVRVVLPSFIDALSELWMADQPFDLPALEREHTRPAFTDLRICLTGFECMDERQRIADTISDNAGLYSGDLTKQTTHLIAFKPEGAKYKYAKTWGVQIVSIEWLLQSQERGMVLDEALYRLDMLPEERGLNAWNKRAARSPLGKRFRDAAPGAEEGKRKTRRTLSTKLNSQNDQIWGDITGGSAATTPVLTTGQWESVPERPAQLQVSRSMVVQPHGTQLLADIRPMLDLARGGAMDGCRVFIFGFSPRHENVLRTHIISHDAEVVASINELKLSPASRPLIIVPHTLSRNEFPSIPDSNVNIQFVTELWVERCMEAKTFIDPGSYRLGRPFPPGPLPGFAELTICSTGLTGVQILHTAKAVALLGAKYDENFSSDHSLLICNPDRPIRAEKLQFAKSNNIPVVTMEWLYDTLELETRQRFRDFALRLPKDAPRRDSSAKSQHERQPKSKPTKENDSLDSFRPRRGSKPARSSGLDTTAFEHEALIAVKAEESSSSTVRSPSDQKAPSEVPIEPLKEISPNSPKKPSPPSEQSEAKPSKDLDIPHKDMSNAICSLLASAKTTVIQQPDASDVSLKRKNRILGRAASNVSRDSRASSVDSTASAGQAVIWPAGSGLHRTASAETKSSMTYVPAEGSVRSGDNDESQPSMTQIRYDDMDSNAHRDQVMAKIRGEKVVDRSHMERVATVASLDQGAAGGRPGRKLRNR